MSTNVVERMDIQHVHHTVFFLFRRRHFLEGEKGNQARSLRVNISCGVLINIENTPFCSCELQFRPQNFMNKKL